MAASRSPGRMRFRMLGALHISGEDAPRAAELAARPKALALLAFLVLESRRGPCTRDAVLVHFWPDSSTTAARHALRQALYELRQCLGPEVIRSRGQHGLVVNRDIVASDADELLDALDVGRVDAALSLHRGELLPGVHFADAPPEFEAWLDDRREDLRRQLTEAVGRAQAVAEGEGDTARAIRLGVQGLELDPFQEPALRRVMKLLHDAGRGAEAIQLFRRFRSRLASELELACAAETEALARSIRDAMGAAPHPAAAVAPPPPPVPSEHVERSTALSPPLAPRRQRWIRLDASTLAVAGAFLMILAAAAALAGVALYRAGPGVDRSAMGDVVVTRVEPRSVASSGGGGNLILEAIECPGDAEAAMVLMSALTWVLEGRDLGSGGRVAGRIEAGGGGWKVDLTLDRDPESVRIAAIVPGDLVAVTRQVVETLAAALDVPGAAHPHTLPVNEAALRTHARGEWLLGRGEVHAAAAAFRRVTELDEGFALAYHRLSVAASMAFDAPTADWAETVAMELQAGMPDTEALVLEARRAYRTGDFEQAESLLGSVLAATPGHPEATYHAAEVMFHYNPLRGRPVVEAQGALDQAARTSGQTEALYHLAQVALLKRDLPEFDRASAEVLRVAPLGFRSVPMRALRARVLGDFDDWRRELAGLGAARDLTVLSAAHNLAVYHADVPAALEVLEILAKPDREPGVRARAHAARADLLAAAGRPSDVATELRRAMEIDPLLGASRAAHLLTLGVLPPDHSGLQAIALSIVDSGPLIARTTSTWIAVEAELDRLLQPRARALAALALGDPGPAQRLIRQIREGGPDDRAKAIILADLALRLHLAGAAAPLERSSLDIRGVTPEEAVLAPLYSRPLARLAQARSSLEAGRLRQGDRWLGSLLEHSISDLALAGIALRERANTARVRGDEAAERAFTHRLAVLQEGAESSYLRWLTQQE